MRIRHGYLLVFTFALLPLLLAKADPPRPALSDPFLQKKSPPGLIRSLSAPAFAHASPVWSIVATADGKQIATAGDFGAVLWDIATGKRVKTLRSGSGDNVPVAPGAESGSVDSVALAPAAEFAGEALRNVGITVVDLVTGKERRLLPNFTALVYIV